MSLFVEKPGLYTTVQDRGRYGLRRFGYVAGGAMDALSMQAANILAGNARHAAVLEWTLQGPRLLLRQDTLAAWCGPELAAYAGGEAVPGWRPVYIRAGTVLTLGGSMRRGCRGYLAVAGGIDVPLALGSRSTYTRAGLGGLEGRPLQAGDELQPGRPSPAAERMMAELRLQADAGGSAVLAAAWEASWAVRPGGMQGDSAVLRVVRGRETARFKGGLEALTGHVYRVRPQSDRMGCRLQGPALELSAPGELVSESTAPGTIQVPPDGQPIVLAADSQTTGGYPRIGHVISADLPILGQLAPGAAVRFTEVTLHEAQAELMRQEMNLRLLRTGVRARMGR
ncbi:biotin-dependent carboxyltransferase family protein [Paenibacillus sp. UNC499MF]|uniref:5-oxoprolinase subunit C family protein n=1 Tax=Paenibacillus sp. UNC499MF TaxID=1502751 RepID=UPI0008A0528C|nr:biotin-dependent carboxyltransferase family protein [Paenibacillus sp. UNC499MF]SEF88347.1 antagonist of KipI [Paenibacillus sp. UNC499MF]